MDTPLTNTFAGDPEFETFPKIPRLFREIVITEKLDGTNAQIVVPDDPDAPLLVGSRNRWITQGKTTDNYGFAAWADTNAVSLRLLGPGRHFGEWYGVGIARGYGLAERRWALFNHAKWKDGLPAGLPRNVHLTPVLYTGPMDTGQIAKAAEQLRTGGSVACPGFKDPEGIVVYHKAGNALFKYTFGGDGAPGTKVPSPIENA